MNKIDIPDKSPKFSQLMLVVNELDEKFDSLQEDLLNRLDKTNDYVKTSIEWLIKTVKDLLEIQRVQMSPDRTNFEGSEWLTTAQAAEYLKRSVYRVRQDINSGKFPAKERNGRYFLRKSDLDSYMDNL